MLHRGILGLALTLALSLSARAEYTFRPFNSGGGSGIGTVNGIVKGDGAGNPSQAVAGTDYVAPSANLTALLALGGTGFPTRTGSNTWAQRTITGTAAEITVTNGDGVSGNPSISLPASISLTGKTITGGTFSSGTFTGGAFNGTLGATTPSTVAGTTGTFSGDFGIGGSSPAFTSTTARYWLLSGAGIGANTLASAGVGGNFSGTANVLGEYAFVNTGLGAADKRVATITGSTDSATNSGGLNFWTANAGTLTSWLSIDHLGAIKLGAGALTALSAGIGGVSGCLASDGATPANITSGPCGTGLPGGGSVGQEVLNIGAGTGNWFTPQAYNVAANASTDCSGAVATALSTVIGANVNAFVPPGCTIKVSADDTIAATKTFTVACGGTITVDNTKTLTIAAHWKDPGPCAIFAGAGSVKLAEARPEYWSCPHSSGSDDAGCIQKAFTSVAAATGTSARKFSVTFTCATYWIASTVTLTLNSGSSVDVSGCGSVGNQPTTIIAKSVFTGTAAVAATGPSANCCMDFKLRGFGILNQLQSGGPANGLEIGSTGPGAISSFNNSLVEDVVVSGFSSQFYVHDIRLIVFRNVAAQSTDAAGTEKASANCFNFQSAFAFTGDSDIYNAQCVGPFGAGTPTGIGAQINGSSAGLIVSGMRWHSPVFYGSATQMKFVSTAGGSVGDHWVNKGQFEGPAPGTSIAIQGIFNSATSSGDLHINDNYISGNGFNNHINITGTGGSVARAIFITGNFLANPNNGLSSVYINATGGDFAGVNIANNIIHGPTDGAPHQNVLVTAGVNHVNFTGNNQDCDGGATLRPYFIELGTGNWGSITGNSSGGCVATGSHTSATSTNIANAGNN